MRGNTSGPLVALLRKAGAAEVHLRVASPPIRHPCFMGVDMSTRDELIAARLQVDEIARQIGVDTLAYLSPAGLLEAVGYDSQDTLSEHGYCRACFTGEYPLLTAAAAGKGAFEQG